MTSSPRPNTARNTTHTVLIEGLAFHRTRTSRTRGTLLEYEFIACPLASAVAQRIGAERPALARAWPRRVCAGPLKRPVIRQRKAVIAISPGRRTRPIPRNRPKNPRSGKPHARRRRAARPARPDRPGRRPGTSRAPPRRYRARRGCGGLRVVPFWRVEAHLEVAVDKHFGRAPAFRQWQSTGGGK